MRSILPPNHDQPHKVIGLHGSAVAWYVASRFTPPARCLVVCPSKSAAEEVFEDLGFFVGKERVDLFPAWDNLPLEPISPAIELSAQRLKVLHTLETSQSFLIVTSAEALAQRLVRPIEALPDRAPLLSLSLACGTTWDRTQLLERLIGWGFTRTRSVDRVGDLSSKGAVLDLFPSTSELPLRIEFAGDTIVRLQLFDSETQRALHPVSSATILPVRERALHSWYNADSARVIDSLKLRAAEIGTPPRELQRALAALEHGIEYPGSEMVQYIAAPPLPTLLDLLPHDTQVIAFDRYQILRALEDFLISAQERADRLVEELHLIPSARAVYREFDELSEHLSSMINTELSSLDDSLARSHAENIRSENLVELATRMKTKVGSGDAFLPLKEFLNEWRQKKFSIAFGVGSATRAQRLQKVLLDIGTDAPILSSTAQTWSGATRRHPVAILNGHLGAGFKLPTERLIFVSESDIFGERSYRSGTAKRISAKKLLNSLSLLKEGDVVVHIDYGIGIYQGLKHLTVEGLLGDFLQIDYADSRLYLPAQLVGKIQKFVGAEGQQPVIDKLGSTRWARTKQKIKDSIVTLAGDLIRTYASRSVAKGWRFEPQGAEDERFADTFAYDETPDQRKAIDETLSDLASDKPMDRLVCGDVGFGKTEVAIRAAFKCTQHARQVAMLVPTTVLVEQHKKSFVERFAGYPVKVGAVSRFYPAAENQKTLEELARGEIDIIVGTHKLLQPDVQFHDLGLLIIDEEHRFGVKQKERLRAIRQNVDVLTLTATPIPRTLHISLLGIRDVSLISTPPMDRKVVQTHVLEKDEALLRDVIVREIRRGGQVFYIHNKVQNIAMVAAHLAELVPEARFDFAHGQMHEHTLERIMRRFIDREIDVLISTTIVESGIDVPNANTIIIDRADQFGLAQLYQLRGRVGRGKRQAFAYLLVPQLRSLTGEAHERLKVLQSLDSLGVGFNLAMRDLEIRGAGNLLGKEQSGSVLSVGFDMYCRILQEAVADMKGEEPSLEDTIDPDVRIIGVDAYIPEALVPDVGERLVLYQRLSNIRSDDEAFDLQREIEDRFGPISVEVDNLMLLMRYRGLLRRHGVVKADVSPKKATVTFSPLALLRDGCKPTTNTRIDGLKVLSLVQRKPQLYRFGKGNSLSIIFQDPERTTLVDVLRMTEQALREAAH
jgi:transcription-repair coupling factor (superfamily II helicase)